MSAIVKPLREKRGGFVVPLVEEVLLFMKEKKGWPDKFCKYYAEKFWNNYEASGWKLSNGNKMKSWQAAFNAQWQMPRYQCDIDLLKKCMENKPAIVREMGASGRLNEILSQYKQDFEKVPDDKLVKVYDYLKEHKMIKLSPDEKQFIKAAYGDNPEKGKAACVKTMFTNMVNHGISF
jgi:hypothetical protein